MMKLPRTQHIEGSRMPAYWKTPDPDAVQFTRLAGQFLVIEEKVDGTGVSIFFDDELTPQVWHRGTSAYGKEFNQLHAWVNLHQEELFDILSDRYILFGEWMLHKHTVFYDRLPHYFLESDVWDRKAGIWLTTFARNNLFTGRSFIKQVPVIASLKPSRLSQITDMVGKPIYQSEHWREMLWKECERKNQPLDKVLEQTDQSNLAEGLYIKHEDNDKVVGRYKYVRYEFLSTIVNSGTHVMDREPVHNQTHGGFDCLS